MTRMPTTTIEYFAFAHLPPHLQTVSKPIGELAHHYEGLLPDGPEKSAGMRKLLEAKDCFVRSGLMLPKPEPKPEPAEPQTGRPEWQERVLEEQKDLTEKCKRLAFALSPADPHLIDSTQRTLMNMQLAAMTTYLHCLDARIRAF